MNAFPDQRSVLVLDNCRIHHNEALVDLVTAAGKKSLYSLVKLIPRPSRCDPSVPATVFS
jgi:hypothetical protein